MRSPSPQDVLVVETVRIPVGGYRLEAEFVYPETTFPVGAVVLAGPHPLLGGSMTNNVIRNLGTGLAQQGLATLRFNYRDQSGGQSRFLARRLAEFWKDSHTADELEYGQDLQGAVDFLIRAVGDKVPVALVGYSFGCSLLPCAAHKGLPTAFVLIAPAVGTHDLEAFTELSQPKLVIAPQGDFAIDENQLPAWFSRLAQPKQLVRPLLDGHFFRGHEEELVQTVRSFLNGYWSPNHGD